MKRGTTTRTTKFGSKTRRSQGQRKGAIILLTAFLMIFLIGVLAFSLDIGYIVTVRTECQRAVDAGALAGEALLDDTTDVVQQAAREYVQYNPVGNSPVPDENIGVEFGQWDENTRSFLPGGEGPTALRVSIQQYSRPLFFGRVFGRDNFSSQAQAVAVYRPRDIVVVLDDSGSMNDDSELKQIPKLGRTAIEANLLQIYTEIGAPVFGSMQWTPRYIASTDANVIAGQLGISNVAYPYPSGSWSDYFSYVQTASSVNNAGYRKRYGYLTLVNYWLERQPMYSQTPDLWKTSEQPITAVKDSFSIFLSYMQQADTNDRVGLTVYTAKDGTAVLESGLTTNYQHIENISRHRQAAHYDNFTNIGAGMKKARRELENNGRLGALKMMVLMTDGIANRPTNTSVARQFVRDEARLAASNGFPIVTISLGTGADTNLMQEVADITSGVHFNVPGGHAVGDYDADLKDVFREIADDRPLMLVQ